MLSTIMHCDTHQSVLQVWQDTFCNTPTICNYMLASITYALQLCNVTPFAKAPTVAMMTMYSLLCRALSQVISFHGRRGKSLLLMAE